MNHGAVGPVIREADFVQSVADALQFISYYHPADYIEHLGRAYAREQSPAAKDAIAQILTNSRMCAEGKRPICQDTGIVNVFVKAGMNVRWDTKRSLQEMVDEGVRRGYGLVENRLRPRSSRIPSSRGRTPATTRRRWCTSSSSRASTVEVTVAAKGGGSENKSTLAMLNPSDSLVDWVLETVPGMGAGWCPPGMLGIGVGGTADKAMVLAKESLMDPIDMHELLARGPVLEARGAAHRDLREGECARDRRPGTRRAHDRARREDPHLPDARGVEARRDDPELRGDAACALRAGRQRAGGARSAVARPLARRALEAFRGVAARESRCADAEEVARLETRPDAAAVGPNVHRARCRAQAAGRNAESGREDCRPAWTCAGG